MITEKIFTKNDYTEAGLQMSYAANRLIKTFLKMQTDKGFNPREVAHVLMHSITTEEAMACIKARLGEKE